MWSNLINPNNIFLNHNNAQSYSLYNLKYKFADCKKAKRGW